MIKKFDSPIVDYVLMGGLFMFGYFNVLGINWKPLGGIVSILVPIAYALAVLFRDPRAKQGYRQLLLMSPWNGKSNLPFGNPFIDHKVILSLIPFALYFQVSISLSFLWIFLILFVTWSGFVTMSLRPKDGFEKYCWGIFWLLPLLYWPHKNLYVGFVVALLWTVICHFSLKKQLMSFGRKLVDAPKVKQGIDFEDQHIDRLTNSYLSPKKDFKTPSVKTVLMVLFGLNYYFFVGMTFLSDLKYFSMNEIFLDGGMSFTLTLFIALGQVLLYCKAPPISCWGRVKNKEFLIPRYDKVFVAPLVTLIWSVVAVQLIPSNLGIYQVMIILTVDVLLIYFLSPKWSRWVLTGYHRELSIPL